MDKSNCIVCGSKRIKLLSEREIKGEKTSFLECQGCGLLFCRPLPRKDLNLIYQKEYYERYTPRFRGKKYRPEKPGLNLIKHPGQAALMEEIQSRAGKKGKLLDVGCGPAWFLWYAHQAGWQAYGLDLSKDVIASNKKFYGWGHFKCGDLAKAGYKKGFFDVVVLNHVIEHCPNPLETLRHCHRLLKKGGLIYLAAPNTDSISAWIKKVKFRFFGGKQYGYLNPPIHLYDFNQETLSRLLEKAGFRVAEVRKSERHAKSFPATPANWLAFLLERLVNLDLIYFLEKFSPGKGNLHIYARK